MLYNDPEASLIQLSAWQEIFALGPKLAFVLYLCLRKLNSDTWSSHLQGIEPQSQMWESCALTTVTARQF